MSTPDLELSDRFVRYLRGFAVGEKQAQTAVTICTALGLEPTETNRRTLRACSQHLNQAGVLVCSGQSGYFVPSTPAEATASARRWRSDARELSKRADRLERLARDAFPASAESRPALFALMEAQV